MMRFFLLLIMIVIVITSGCSYGRNYTPHKMANGAFLHGTDHNTVYPLSKGSHSNREWVCEGAEFNNSCRAIEPKFSENNSILGTLAMPTALGYGLSKSGSINNTNANASASANSSAFSGATMMPWGD